MPLRAGEPLSEVNKTKVLSIFPLCSSTATMRPRMESICIAQSPYGPAALRPRNSAEGHDRRMRAEQRDIQEKRPVGPRLLAQPLDGAVGDRRLRGPQVPIEQHGAGALAFVARHAFGGDARARSFSHEQVGREIGHVVAEVVVEAACGGAAADRPREIDPPAQGARGRRAAGLTVCNSSETYPPLSSGQSQPRCHLPMAAVR